MRNIMFKLKHKEPNGERVFRRIISIPTIIRLSISAHDDSILCADWQHCVDENGTRDVIVTGGIESAVKFWHWCVCFRSLHLTINALQELHCRLPAAV